jgi:hypothetical protein
VSRRRFRTKSADRPEIVGTARAGIRKRNKSVGYGRSAFAAGPFCARRLSAGISSTAVALPGSPGTRWSRPGQSQPLFMRRPAVFR